MNTPDCLTAIRPWDGTEPDLGRYLADRAAAAARLDEENLILGMGWTASVCQSHEVMLTWSNATAPRFREAALRRAARAHRAKWAFEHTSPQDFGALHEAGNQHLAVARQITAGDL